MAHHDHDTHRTPDDEYLVTPEGSSYEHTDANVWVIAKFGIWLAITAVAVHLGIGVLWRTLVNQATEVREQQYPLAASIDPKLPPEPRLQQFPSNEIYRFRDNEEQRLHSYGYVNKDAGVVHIPIDRAMQVLAGRHRAADRKTGCATTPREIQRDVGVEPQLGKTIPGSLSFRDEQGQPLSFLEVLHDKPAILALVYYGCSNLCSLTLRSIGGSLHRLGLTPGRDFEIVAVSIDPRDGPAIARSKLTEYLNLFGGPAEKCCDNGWHFLTGTRAQSTALARAVGYRYFWDAAQSQYAHAAGIVILSPRGEVTQYFNGIEFPPRELRQALLNASAGRVNSLSDRLWLLCYHYEALIGPYSTYITMALRALGLVVIAALAGLIIRLIRTSP